MAEMGIPSDRREHKRSDVPLRTDYGDRVYCGCSAGRCRSGMLARFGDRPTPWTVRVSHQMQSLFRSIG